jgi:hypothetical protein
LLASFRLTWLKILRDSVLVAREAMVGGWERRVGSRGGGREMLRDGG